MSAYYWVEIDFRSRIPQNALCGGVDVDGAKIYVGKAFHMGDWIPSKVIPIKKVAYVACGGNEHAKDICQVLCGPNHRFEWVRASNGVVPPCSIEGGRTSTGEPLYIGRVKHCSSQTVGKIHPSHRVCYISFGGKEIAYKDYEILIMRG